MLLQKLAVYIVCAMKWKYITAYGAQNDSFKNTFSKPDYEVEIYNPKTMRAFHICIRIAQRKKGKYLS